MAFVFDDQSLVDRYELEGPHQVWSGFRSWWRNERVLTLVVDLACMKYFGLRAGWWHAVNLGLHLVNVYLVACLFGWSVALLFAIHPITGGLCLYVNTRADMLMTACAIASALCVREGGLWWFGAIFFLWLSRAGKACGPIATVILWLTVWFFFG